MKVTHPLNVAICAAAIASSLAVCAVEIEVTPGASEIQLMPAGHFAARDGRPGNDAKSKTDAWYIDAEIAASVIALAHARKTPFVIDYSHQTITTQNGGHQAPAAGWFSKLEWREGDGLYAVDVAWTPRATEYLANKEYRFISPVFSYTTEGNVVELMMAAITNFPAVDGMDEILAAASTYFQQHTTTEDDDMDRSKLIKILGLKEDADDDAIFVALQTLVDGKTAADTQVATLTTDLEKAQAQKPDPEQYVPRETYDQVVNQVAALTTDTNEEKVKTLVDKGIEDKKILPAEKAWAMDLGNKNLASLQTFLDNRKPFAVLSTQQTDDKDPDDKSKGKHSETDIAVCSQMGLNPDDLLTA